MTDVWRILSSVGPRFHEPTTGPQPPSPALVRMFEAHKDRLSVKPAEAAKRLRAVTLAVTHPVLNDDADVVARGGQAVPLRRARAERLVLIRLLRDHLGPYRKIIYGVLLLQTVQTTAALTLPTLNARIIDNGILKQDQGYIWKIGGVMLGASLVQIVFSVGAVVSRRPNCDGLRSRPAQQPVPQGHELLRPRSRTRWVRRRSSRASPMTCNRFRCSW